MVVTLPCLRKVDVVSFILEPMPCNDGQYETYTQCDGLESAFLSFEDWSDKFLGFIYEIYVLPEFRNQSLGGSLLQKAEEVAIKLGCVKLQLDVHPFDRTLDKSALYSWYSEKGYVRASSKSERMEKALSSK